MTILGIEPLINNLRVALLTITILVGIVSVIVGCIGTEKKKVTIISAIIFAISAVGFICSVVFVPENLPDKYKYYVEFDDIDDAEEILSDYILLESHGNLYVIKDK